jgi:thioesterase domain-containing protein
MEVFKKLEKNLVVASKNYRITPYHKDILVFYAKEHYYFWDKDKNVRFKQLYLDNETKDTWTQYARSTTMYEIEGDHSTIFYPDNAQEFAVLLQKHLNNSNGKITLPTVSAVSA